MKKNRIIGGILAAALAIVPFTGTGIDSIDKELTKETAITADAYAYNTIRGGIYVSNNYQWVGPRHFRKGEYMSISSDGKLDGVDVTNWIHQGWISYCWS